ncbi:HypC/HybG/HupF family hydrogenase formation chaperone [Halomonas organivorans]
MCLGIPGRIVSIVDDETDTALVEIAGIRRAINIACVVEEDGRHADCVGDWVLVHVGFAMSRIDAEEAARTLELLRELGEMDEELRQLQTSARRGGEHDR